MLPLLPDHVSLTDQERLCACSCIGAKPTSTRLTKAIWLCLGGHVAKKRRNYAWHRDSAAKSGSTCTRTRY